MSNLPQVAQLDFPESDMTSQQVTNQRVYATFDWDFETGDFKLRDGKLIPVTGLDYLIIWMQKALRTVINTLIYTGTNYGSGHFSLIGQNFHPDYEKSELTRMIKEALSQNDAITSVEAFAFSQTGSRVTVNFTVKSIYGTTNQEVVV